MEAKLKDEDDGFCARDPITGKKSFSTLNKRELSDYELWVTLGQEYVEDGYDE